MFTPSAQVPVIPSTLYPFLPHPRIAAKCDCAVKNQKKLALKITFCETLSPEHFLISSVTEAVSVINPSSYVGMTWA